VANLTRTIVWLRGDLRLSDHPAWAEAARHGDALPVFVWDARWAERSPSGAPRLGGHRARFWHQALADLQERVNASDGGLWVEVGRPPEVLARLAEQWGAARVVVHPHPAPYERADEAELERLLLRSGRRLERIAGGDLYEPQDLPFAPSQVAELFTDFRKVVERQGLVRRPLPAVRIRPWPSALPSPLSLPTLTELGYAEPTAAPILNGGTTHAAARIDHYLWQTDGLRRYKATRNGLLGLDYSSKLSPYLAAGCCSPRELWHETLRYEQARGASDSTYWLRFELLWREFFRLQVGKHGGRYFRAEGPQGLVLPWGDDPALLRAWTTGQTGIPIVDAAMRELAATGFMGNRARQLVASYLTKNLVLDWRLGAEHFEHALIDYEPCANYGNWCYAAGVGADLRGFRYFHLEKQAAEHDPDGAYVKHWCPELAALPAAKVHAPHLLRPDEQRRYGVSIGRDYPAPVVDLAASVRENEAAYNAAVADQAVGAKRRLGNYRLQQVRQASADARAQAHARRATRPPRRQHAADADFNSDSGDD